MREALQAGTIDAMVMNIMEMQADEKRLAEFMPAPFFYLLRKEDAALKRTLDEALSSLHLDAPGLSQHFMKKWYPETLKTPYSRAELDYLAAVRHHLRQRRVPATGGAHERSRLGNGKPQFFALSPPRRRGPFYN